jgi:c-di-GMP-binding flagellar brake protein YcgR
VSEEKRKAPRASYPCEVACDMFTGGTPQTFRLSDLSTGGAFIDAMVELQPGSRVGLRFSTGPREIQVNAEVVHAMPHFGMGVRFIDLSEEDRVEIDRLVRELGE